MPHQFTAMDRDNSPSPSPRPQPFTSSSLFTSPPFTSTLPLSHPLTRPTSDSLLQRYQKPSSKSLSGDYYRKKGTRRPLRTRSANSSVPSDSDSDGNYDFSALSAGSLGNHHNSQMADPTGSPEKGSGSELEKEDEKNDNIGISDRSHPKENLSDYTVNLANLKHNSSGGRDQFATVRDSDYDIQVPVRPRDVVDSEDDGPEDFTVELGKWMKGVKPWDRTGEAAKIEGDKEEEKAMKEAHNSGNEQAHDSPDEFLGKKVEAMNAADKPKRASVEDAPEGETLSVFQPPLVSTPMRSVGQPLDLEPKATEERDMSTTPLVTPPQPRSHQERSTEEIFEQVSALQAELERLRLETENHHNEKVAWEEERGHWEEEIQQLTDDLEDDRREIDRLLEVKNAQATEIEDLKATSIIAVKAKDHAELRVEELASQCRTAQAELSQQRSRLQDYESQCHAKETELDSLRSDLANCKNDFADYKRSSQSSEQSLISQNEELQGRLNDMAKTSAEVTLLRSELEHAQSQLTETRRILETVEDENDRLMQQNKQREEKIGILNLELANAGDKKTDVEEGGQSTDQRVPTPTGENDPWTGLDDYNGPDVSITHLELADNLDNLTAHYESELSSLRTAHAAEIKKLKQTLFRAAEGMQKREAKINKAHKEEVGVLGKQIEDLKAASERSGPQKGEGSNSASEDTEPVAELRAAIRALSAKLKASQSAITVAERQIESLRRDVQDLRDEASERERTHEAAIKALEAKFAAAYEEREEEWERRVELLFRDREKMSRVLMLGWGKEEVGERIVDVEGKSQRRMGYRYRAQVKA